MRKSELRILLLQIRANEQVRKEEHASFAAYSGLDVDQFQVLNVFDTQHFEGSVLDGYDGLFIGGASEASVMEPERYLFVKSCIQLIQYCLANDVPVFASCFGFQLAVLALDGRIVRDQSDYEMGTPAISLTPASREDALFKDVPDGFRAVSVHKERTPKLPAGCVLLAETEACPHAFRVEGRQF